ncbi:MAG: GTP cyclohydrolase I FolE [Deltaproteobacteria bacterium]|nr:GTP cyclohydrolase I FolE [Deltaproteobacteria bacterium]
MLEKNHATDSAEAAVKELIKLIGEDTNREGLKRTPHRVVKSLLELTSGYNLDPKSILSTTFTEKCNEMVVVRNIQFWSLCEHHMLPFHGTATVGYLPKDRIVGLSKIGRLVHCFARRLQVQERMTEEIANALQENLSPYGVGVIVRATHTCMEMRGVKTAAEMMTSCLLGQFREPATRSEFLALR